MEQTRETAKVEKKKAFSKIFRYWPWMLVILCILGLMLGYYIRSLDNSLPERATKLRVNKAVSDHIKDKFDHNWYTFTLPADGYITLQVDHPVLDSEDFYWIMHLYEDNKRTAIPPGCCWKITGNQNELSAEIGLPAGTYYIEIEPHGKHLDTSEYTLRVNFTESDTCETERNDHFERADKITVNTDYTGCTMSDQDTDIYVVTLPADGCVTLQFTHPIFDSDGKYWYVKLYKSDGKTVVTGCSWNIFGDNNLLTSEKTLPAGTYYILISSYYCKRTTSTYTLRVNYEPVNE